LGTFLFSGEVRQQFHIFRLAPDGSVTDLTQHAEAERGRLSPDGKKIAFHAARSGTLGIWVMDADGSRPVRLTNNGEIDPEWSPDGKKLVFAANATVGFGPITVMNADGSGRHDIGRGSEPNWSSTGRIAFEEAGSNCLFDICPLNLYTMNPDGSDVVKLTSNSGAFDYTVAPCWSPDGSMIAYYTSGLFLPRSLRIMNANGSGMRTIASNRNFVGAAVWSPDGRSLAYAVSDSSGTSRILVQPLDGGAPAVILQREGLLEPTSWVK
jgi:Tol biopolymer transport system component